MDILDLNYLAQAIDEMQQNEVRKYSHILNSLDIQPTINEMIVLAVNIDQLNFNENIKMLSELGDDFLSKALTKNAYEKAKNSTDLAKIGT